MLNILLKKIIKTGAGRVRYILAMVGLGVALLLILAAIQLQSDYWQLLHGNNAQDSIANFLVINKQIKENQTGNTNLSKQEIQDLKNQSFIQDVGVVTPSRFKVGASGGSAMPFYTDMFFESVPDEFLDITSADWKWDDQSQFIPIVIPNQFLDMYNFGFAKSQNLPQLSQELVKNIPIHIDIQTPAGQKSFYAKVAGFSDRISSILVPQKFMEWANKHFATEPPQGASRVIIRTDDPSNPRLMQYLESHQLTTDLEKTRFSKYRQIVGFVVQVSGFTGLAMFLFALLIFSLFIELTIASCREEISLLVTLGASPRQLSKFLMKTFYPSNMIIALLVLILLSLFQWLLSGLLAHESMVVSPWISLYTIMGALIVLLILWWVHMKTIQKQIAGKT